MIGMFALALLGGLWFPESLMPAVMKSIAHVTPSYDYASIGWQIAAGEAPHAADAAGILAWGWPWWRWRYSPTVVPRCAPESSATVRA